MTKRSATGVKKTRCYSVEYLTFGFMESNVDKTKPECFLCGDVLSNEAMKPAKLKRHQESKHPGAVNQDRMYFEVRCLFFLTNTLFPICPISIF